MLAPDKNTNIKYSIPYIAGLELKEIQRNGIIKYDELKNYIVQTVGKNVGDNFEYSLSFLFLLGKITYKKDLDSFISITL